MSSSSNSFPRIFGNLREDVKDLQIEFGEFRSEQMQFDDSIDHIERVFVNQGEDEEGDQTMGGDTDKELMVESEGDEIDDMDSDVETSLAQSLSMSLGASSPEHMEAEDFPENIQLQELEESEQIENVVPALGKCQRLCASDVSLAILKYYNGANWCVPCLTEKYAQNKVVEYFGNCPRQSQIAITYDTSHIRLTHENDALWVLATNLSTRIKTIIFYGPLLSGNYGDEIAQILRVIEGIALDRDIDIVVKSCDLATENGDITSQQKCLMLSAKKVSVNILFGLELVIEGIKVKLDATSSDQAKAFRNSEMKKRGLSYTTPINISATIAYMRTMCKWEINVNSNAVVLPESHPVFELLFNLEKLVIEFSKEETATEYDCNILVALISNLQKYHRNKDWANSVARSLQLALDKLDKYPLICKTDLTVWPLETIIKPYNSQDFFESFGRVIRDFPLASNDFGLSLITFDLECYVCHGKFTEKNRLKVHRRACLTIKLGIVTANLAVCAEQHKLAVEKFRNSVPHIEAYPLPADWSRIVFFHFRPGGDYRNAKVYIEYIYKDQRFVQLGNRFTVARINSEIPAHMMSFARTQSSEDIFYAYRSIPNRKKKVRVQFLQELYNLKYPNATNLPKFNRILN